MRGRRPVKAAARSREPEVPVRGRPRDPEATKRRLLDAAEKAFVDLGFAAARVDEIARTAGVNKRMIYAYFGNKEDLYLRVLKDAYDRVLQAESGAVDLSPDALTAAETLIRRYFRFLAARPGFVRLIGHEMLNTGPRAGEAHVELSRVGLERLGDVLARGIREGAFRADLDIRMLVVSIASICLGVFQRQAILARIWALDVTDANTQAAFEDHVLHLVLDGVRPQREVGHA